MLHLIILLKIDKIVELYFYHTNWLDSLAIDLVIENNKVFLLNIKKIT